MRSLFRSRAAEPSPTVEPVRTEFPAVEGAGMAAVFSGNRVAGDFYDAVRANHNRVLFGLLDVAGRREDTRGILIAAQNIFRTLGPELFVKPDINESDAMTELCHLLNRSIIDTAAGVRPCPGFLGCYNEQMGTLCYTNAGHIPGLLRDHSGIVELGSTGLPLGLFSHATNDAPTVGLEPGAALLLVSRGVVEGKDKRKRGPEFGLECVKELFRDDPLSDPQALCSSILNAIGECQYTAPVHDDQTALAFVRKP
jgi:serine phosphatase RsbU (regulator of sigma subunit)